MNKLIYNLQFTKKNSEHTIAKKKKTMYVQLKKTQQKQLGSGGDGDELDHW